MKNLIVFLPNRIFKQWLEIDNGPTNDLTRASARKKWRNIMLDNSKLERIVDKMKEQDMPQMIISDPVSIFYLIGKWIIPGSSICSQICLVVSPREYMLIIFWSNSDMSF